MCLLLFMRLEVFAACGSAMVRPPLKMSNIYTHEIYLAFMVYCADQHRYLRLEACVLGYLANQYQLGTMVHMGYSSLDPKSG